MFASCWLFLYGLYYDARNHEHQAGLFKLGFRMINFGLRAEEYFVTPETRFPYNVQVYKIS
jgi:hypothetical protein